MHRGVCVCIYTEEPIGCFLLRYVFCVTFEKVPLALLPLMPYVLLRGYQVYIMMYQLACNTMVALHFAPLRWLHWSLPLSSFHIKSYLVLWSYVVVCNHTADFSCNTLKFTSDWLPWVSRTSPHNEETEGVRTNCVADLVVVFRKQNCRVANYILWGAPTLCRSLNETLLSETSSLTL